MDAAKPRPFRAEYAKTGRASCKKCKDPIAKDVLRIAKVIEARGFDGYMTLWYHASCLMENPGSFNSVDDVDGADLLRWEDQQKLKKYADREAVGGGGGGRDKGATGSKGKGRPGQGGGKEKKPSFVPGGENVSEYSIEYAKSSRATCKGCEEKILKDEVRISKLVESENPQFRGHVPAWRHVPCFFTMESWSHPVELLPGFPSLSEEDQKWVASAKTGADKGLPAERRMPGGNGKEAAASTQAEKGVASKKRGRGAKTDAAELEEKEEEKEVAPKGRGQRGKKPVKTVVEDDDSDSKSGGGGKSVEAQKNSKAGNKRVKTANDAPAGKATGTGTGKDEEKQTRVRKARVVEDNEIKSVEKKAKTAVPSGRGRKVEDDDNEKKPVVETKSKTELQFEKDMEKQTKALWEIKDALRKHVSTAEMREMLEENGLDPAGSETELRERCADGMLFGPLEKCPVCGTPSLEYSGGQYRCRGFLSEWSKCTYATRESIRRADCWELPRLTKNDYLLQWSKKMSKNAISKRPVRLLPPQVSSIPRLASNELPRGGEKEQQVVEGTSSNKPLSGLVIAFVGKLKRTQVQWKDLVTAAGGKLVTGITSATNCVVTTPAEVERENVKLAEAKSNKVPIVAESFLEDCIEKKMRMRIAEYSLADALKGNEVATVKVKGRGAVHVDSGLQDKGHVLENGQYVYNTTLSISDMTTGMNSYYIMQVIEADDKSECWIFRKWGRVGDAKRGGQKIEAMKKNAAMEEFQTLFKEKTGNSWNTWCTSSGDIRKVPGKFYPLEIDYGVDETKHPAPGSGEVGSKSKFHPRLVALLKMLFDLEAYKATMMEFEINLSEMPLGKLSKRHIERGFAMLQEIQNLLQMQFDAENSARRDGMLVDASNRFYTLIPTVQPAPISSDEALKSKIGMLEALRDIEIAAKLIGEAVEEGIDPLDANYQKLKCDLVPLPHDSGDFSLIKKYLKNTHAPTHKEWDLELEDVFTVNREGEEEKYAPFRDQLNNKMLLWHGSRTTNYVGILSQGLRIAPPEAPVTGYMFGKGIYFADMVSKSAQYCFTSRKNPVGLLLLSEVGLGDMYPRKSAMYMDKPPSGHSTIGLGLTKPLESEFEKWNKNVVVPCGHPVPSKISGTALQYNEYIVYDTSQVKLQFLLKVRFKYKRGAGWT